MKILIPTPLRAYTGSKASVDVDATTVQGALDGLTTAHPEIKQHLFNAEGKLRSFVNVYLNDDDIRFLPEKENAPAKAEDELSIIPSIAGGTPVAEAPASPLRAELPKLSNDVFRNVIYIKIRVFYSDTFVAIF